jgi:hypothetical protein
MSLPIIAVRWIEWTDNKQPQILPLRVRMTDPHFDANIHGETARSEVIRYIHRNPVKRGLVASPEQYRWSSFNHYATGIPGVVEIESEGTARTRGPLIAIKPL